METLNFIAVHNCFNLFIIDSFHTIKINLVIVWLYRETRIKTVLDTSEDGSLLTFNQSRIFNFSPETSGAGLRETDTICTVNIPLVVKREGKGEKREREKGGGGGRERERELEGELSTV